jgi:hypothetical protein
MDKMEIKSGNQSEVIQVGRDLHVGLSYDDIKSIFYDLFKLNFPQLVQEATKTAQTNLEQYINVLINKMKSNSDAIDSNKLQDPNIQFLLNESIKQTARKGNKIDLELLSDLIITTINKDTNETLDIVSSEAVLVIPKLSKEHIAFLSLCIM